MRWLIVTDKAEDECGELYEIPDDWREDLVKAEHIVRYAPDWYCDLDDPIRENYNIARLAIEGACKREARLNFSECSLYRSRDFYNFCIKDGVHTTKIQEHPLMWFYDTFASDLDTVMEAAAAIPSVILLYPDLDHIIFHECFPDLQQRVKIVTGRLHYLLKLREDPDFEAYFEVARGDIQLVPHPADGVHLLDRYAVADRILEKNPHMYPFFSANIRNQREIVLKAIDYLPHNHRGYLDDWAIDLMVLSFTDEFFQRREDSDEAIEWLLQSNDALEEPRPEATQRILRQRGDLSERAFRAWRDNGWTEGQFLDVILRRV